MRDLRVEWKVKIIIIIIIRNNAKLIKCTLDWIVDRTYHICMSSPGTSYATTHHIPLRLFFFCGKFIRRDRIPFRFEFSPNFWFLLYEMLEILMAMLHASYSIHRHRHWHTHTWYCVLLLRLMISLNFNQHKRKVTQEGDLNLFYIHSYIVQSVQRCWPFHVRNIFG